MAINLRVIDNFTLVDIVLTAEKVTLFAFSLNFLRSYYKFEMWNKDGISYVMFMSRKVCAA